MVSFKTPKPFQLTVHLLRICDGTVKGNKDQVTCVHSMKCSLIMSIVQFETKAPESASRRETTPVYIPPLGEAIGRVTSWAEGINISSIGAVLLQELNSGSFLDSLKSS